MKELMERIATVWECDPSRYPELAGMDTTERKNFLIKHSVLHITKTAGKLAALCEDYDHTKQTSPEAEEKLKAASVKMFINALKLAEEAGLSADELLERAPGYVK
ncbi:MAG: hypothetical protein WDN10_01485 [bacterium]